MCKERMKTRDEKCIFLKGYHQPLTTKICNPSKTANNDVLMTIGSGSFLTDGLETNCCLSLYQVTKVIIKG